MITAATVWTLILVLGVGTYLIRFSFLGLFGGRRLPEFVQRHLRYTPVAVLPGLVAPLVLFPEATGGMPDLARGLAALATLWVGLMTRNVLGAMASGAGTLYLVLFLQSQM